MRSALPSSWIPTQDWIQSLRILDQTSQTLGRNCWSHKNCWSEVHQTSSLRKVAVHQTMMSHWKMIMMKILICLTIFSDKTHWQPAPDTSTSVRPSSTGSFLQQRKLRTIVQRESREQVCGWGAGFLTICIDYIICHNKARTIASWMYLMVSFDCWDGKYKYFIRT